MFCHVKIYNTKTAFFFPMKSIYNYYLVIYNSIIVHTEFNTTEVHYTYT